MTRISVIAVSPLDNSSWRYNVEIFENNGSGSKTSYQVTLDKEYYMDLTEKGRIVPEEFVKKSFKFLLDRESKDSILRQFDIAEITDFFPEYEKEIKKVLDRNNHLH
jgi:hypothetical protein